MADGDRLYRLLPAIYRLRDEEQGGPLRALLSIIAEQVEVLEEDLAQRWDDHFIETCAGWLVPYIGDLVGTTPLFDAGRIRQPDTAGTRCGDLTGPSLLPEVAQRGRADVARTIHYRRRKATRPMLEAMARDVTGWAVHVVEFFERLGWSQWVRDHVRPGALHAPDLRRLDPLDRLPGPFDVATHTVDVRPIATLEGWYGIRKIGFFTWRLRSDEVTSGSARRIGGPGDYRFTVSPLGHPAPLFARWRPRGDDAGLATEPHLPAPIRPSAFYDDLQAYLARPTPRPGVTEFYGLFGVPETAAMPPAPDRSLLIIRDGVPVPPDTIRCMSLRAWAQPSDPIVGVDVRLGRLAFGAGFEPAEAVDVCYHHGVAAGIGGGTYARQPWLVRRALADLVVTVDQTASVPGSVTSVAGALAAWEAAGKPNAIISIADNHSYAETLGIEPADGRWLVIEAADRRRPHLRLGTPLEITGTHPDAAVTLSGLLIEGQVRVTGSLGRLRLLHTTLVPGGGLDADGLPVGTDPSLVVDAGPADAPQNERLEVDLAFVISGPLRVPTHVRGLWLLDSIVDGLGGIVLAAPGSPNEPGPPSWIERSTVLGEVLAAELTLASETIFTAPVAVQRRQTGCVRFSFVPPGSRVPRRHRCQPDDEIAARIAAAVAEGGGSLTQAARDAIAAAVTGWLVPSFTSTRYGQPAYGQLHLGCPRQITTGAEDGSEMGVLCHLKQPQRAENLRQRLAEYLPFGLDPGIIHVT
jgi:hypothetical protein